MKFETENDLSLNFKKFISTNLDYKNIEILEQFKGLYGIPDFLLVEKGLNSISTVISIELKLNNWKQALKQAFKYRSFSNYCYIVLDETFLNRAVKKIDQFIHFNIGLASFNKNNELKIYFTPKNTEPFSKFLFNKIPKFLNINPINKYEPQYSQIQEILALFTRKEPKLD
ncbi:MAG: hypothetical protein ACOC56_02500 [Atribacterota bacterium]